MDFDFYETESGEDIVGKEILSILPKKTQEIVKKKLIYYEEKTFSDLQRGNFLEKIEKSKLWELKFFTTPPHRGFCFLIEKSKLLILHVFKHDYKKGIGQQHIDVANQRCNDYLSRTRKY